ncbi:hypothetical protein BaRGS_00029190, partial [Batillaria attramentaria]
TADPEYIRAISVKYNRCPSSYSTRSAVSLSGFRLKSQQRPKTAVEIVPQTFNFTRRSHEVKNVNRSFLGFREPTTTPFLLVWNTAAKTEGTFAITTDRSSQVRDGPKTDTQNCLNSDFHDHCE